MGAYGDKDGNSETSGLAKLGFTGELSYSHALAKGEFGRMKSEFGLVAMLRGRMNGVSSDGATSVFKDQFPTYQWRANNKSWQTAAAMAGFYRSLSVNEKFSAHALLIAGIAKAWMPEIIVTGIMDSTAQGGDANMIVARNEKTSATTFTAMTGLGISYALTNKFSLMADLDFWYLKPTFTVVQDVAFAQHLVVPGVYNLSNGSVVSVTQATGKYKQGMNSLNLTVGVSMKL